MCGSLDVARTRCTKQTTKLPRRDCGAEHEGRHVLIAPGFGRLLTGFRPNRADPFQTSLSWVGRTRRVLSWLVRPGLPTAGPASPREAQARAALPRSEPPRSSRRT